MARLLAAVVILFFTACQRHTEVADNDPRVTKILEAQFAWIRAGRCAYHHLGADTSRLFVYYNCQAQDGLQGAAGAAVVHIDEYGEPQKLSLPRDGSDHATDIERMFPSSTVRVLRNDGRMATIRKRVELHNAR